jgi:hypothetical protein
MSPLSPFFLVATHPTLHTRAALTELFRRRIKIISERSIALTNYFSQLCALPQVVTSQPFQSFFEVEHRGGYSALCGL